MRFLWFSVGLALPKLSRASKDSHKMEHIYYWIVIHSSLVLIIPILHYPLNQQFNNSGKIKVNKQFYDT